MIGPKKNYCFSFKHIGRFCGYILTFNILAMVQKRGLQLLHEQTDSSV